ncbi:MAG: protein tyrosine phosphatase family protein, partial [Pseudomonadota bacterium]
DLDHILNWRRINARLTTSGQPDAEQLTEIGRLGVTHVVNLGLGHGEGALEGEAEIVAALGMAYSHIPVDFENPMDSDFEAFRAILEQDPAATMHIHCIYNARVSAFLYRYARTGREVSEDAALANMASIWRPGDDWADFVGNPDARGQPNRYAGEDY